jgi:hypothetical protein
MYSFRHVSQLVDVIRDYDLDYSHEMLCETVGTLQVIYNGCGPEILPEVVRKNMTSYFEFFEAAILIHDWDFTKLKKTEENFKIANSRLYSNCKILSYEKTKWWQPSRYRRLLQSYLIYKSCSKLGKSAWKD